MKASNLTLVDMLEIKFRKARKKGNCYNTTLRPSYSHPAIPPGEQPIVEVVNKAAQSIFLTQSGFTLPQRGFVRYTEIKKVIWVGRDRDVSRKTEEFDRIEFELIDGKFEKIIDLGQAVFPLLSFFEWVINQTKAN